MPRTFWSLCLAAAIAVGCGGGTREGGGDTGSEDRVDGTGYQVEMPEGWRDQTKAADGTAIRVDRLLADDPEDGFATNIVVIRETPSGGPTLDQVTEQFEQQAASQADDAGVSPTEDRELAGEPARTYSYQLDRTEPPDVRQRQIFAVKDGAIYTLTFSAISQRFEQEEAVFDRFLDSWRWK